MISILMSLELIINGFISLFLFLCLGCCLLKYGLLSKNMCEMMYVSHVYNFHLSVSMKLSSTTEISILVRSNMKIS